MKSGVKYEVVPMSGGGAVGYILDGVFFQNGQHAGEVDSDGRFSMHDANKLGIKLTTGQTNGNRLVRGDGCIFLLREC
ncbi:hypothetical protein LH435_04770 [Laribacter hongkongensis]|uniref:hypothetical protein n=1 Tax=Laribacter hongkongensis TaxID=168471 RepID=UPI001EFD6B6A|nr:hypothetical protein [Laribacter hongkongensis]MCG8996631.1 hypothetical protein [Laribacter hongkongensis]MCG9011978.1 hypothetical protein [Laribacter hongkongensis]MCG9073337.1 hypothetical protein [Laribacter hongkongensis]